MPMKDNLNEPKDSGSKKSLLMDAGNRIWGLCEFALASWNSACPYILLPITVPFAAEMIRDIITGEHITFL